MLLFATYVPVIAPHFQATRQCACLHHFQLVVHAQNATTECLIVSHDLQLKDQLRVAGDIQSELKRVKEQLSRHQVERKRAEALVVEVSDLQAALAQQTKAKEVRCLGQLMLLIDKLME